jgi:hypothetical protein
MRKMLAPRGVFYLPVETWGALQVGINPTGASPDPDDLPALTGDRERDAAALALIIYRAMVGRKAPPLPDVVIVPLVWAKLEPAMRDLVLEKWKTTYHVPRTRILLQQAGFTSIQPVRFTPLFLKANPEAKAGLEYLACRS